MHIVISDTHIGDNRVDVSLNSLLRLIEDTAAPDSHLILNGDIFDLVVQPTPDSRHGEFIAAARKHGRVTYIGGNHDWTVTGLGSMLAPTVVFRKEWAEVLGGKKFHFLHGHQMDRVALLLPRTSRVVIRLNHWLIKHFRFDYQKIYRDSRFGKWNLRRLEDRLTRQVSPWADVLVAGHTHEPGIHMVDGRLYVNTGDWSDPKHRAYLLIDDDGTHEFRLLDS